MLSLKWFKLAREKCFVNSEAISSVGFEEKETKAYTTIISDNSKFYKIIVNAKKFSVTVKTLQF